MGDTNPLLAAGVWGEGAEPSPITGVLVCGGPIQLQPWGFGWGGECPIRCHLRGFGDGGRCGRQCRLPEDLHRAYFNLGHIRLRAGDPSGALRCLARARDCARAMGEKGLESECCSSTGQVGAGTNPTAAPPLGGFGGFARAGGTFSVPFVPSVLQVLLGLGDFVAAKRALRQAHALGSRQPGQRELVRASLRYGERERCPQGEGRCP